MSLSDWLFRNHVFFCGLRKHLLDVITAQDITCLDDLVVSSRRPVRTVLLALEQLIEAGVVEVASNSIAVKTQDATRSRRAISRTKKALPTALTDQYLKLVATREEPVLLWGQRRLLPQSAVERALYILRWISGEGKKLVFLGDDDMVSPLVAALAPEWSIEVLDLDGGVLELADHVARELGGNLRTVQADMSEASLGYGGTVDAVICDPFPSGDGSFEAMFWGRAAEMLRSDGILITTVSPSHKPEAFAAGAFRQLGALGFCPLDVQANFGCYEVFDFEFVPAETAFLRREHLQSAVSHTKSLLAAKYVRSDSSVLTDTSTGFDFKMWVNSASKHYLTVQAGADQQQQIATQRGGHAPQVIGEPCNGYGLRIEVLAPKPFRKSLVDCRGDDAGVLVSRLKTILEEQADLTLTDEEGDLLLRLAYSSDLVDDGPLVKLGLAVRALESWERWRLSD